MFGNHLKQNPCKAETCENDASSSELYQVAIQGTDAVSSVKISLL